MRHVQFRTYGTRELPALPAINQINAKTASYTCVIDDAGKRFTNRGASGAITFTLPAPTTVSPGDRFTFSKVANQNVVINAGVAAGFRTLTGTGVTLTNSTSADYAFIQVESDGTEWLVVGSNGTWALA